MPEEVSPEVARGMPRDKINFPSNPRDASHEERETDVWKAVWMPWALDDEEAQVRSHAAWGLARLGAKQACVALQARLAVEEDVEVCEEIEWALRQLQREEPA